MKPMSSFEHHSFLKFLFFRLFHVLLSYLLTVSPLLTSGLGRRQFSWLAPDPHTYTGRLGELGSNSE